MIKVENILNLQPDLSGNPFLWLEKLRQKDWERKAEIAAQINLSFSNQQILYGKNLTIFEFLLSSRASD